MSKADNQKYSHDNSCVWWYKLKILLRRSFIFWCVFISCLFVVHVPHLCVGNSESNSNVSHYCDTDRGLRQGTLLKDPCLCWEQSSFCVLVFSFAAPSTEKTAVLQASAMGHPSCTMIVFVAKYVQGKPKRYSHLFRLTQGCQKGLVGRADPVVQVDPSEK